MLHDGHELDGVVPQFMDARENIGRELCELTNASLCRGNADYMSSR